MMKTLIIPCVGSEKIYGLPLILNKHPKDGIILAKKVLSGIFPESYDRIIYTVTAEMEQKFSISTTIQENIERAEVIILSEKTLGFADTVYKTILKAGISGEFAVKDSRNRISLNTQMEGNAIAGLDLMQYEYAVRDLRSKSFIILNEQGNICDITEKRLRSDIISAGLYSFRDTEDFVSAFLRLSDPDYDAERLYVSHIISYLIGRRDFVFHCSKTQIFEDWYDSEAWRNLRQGSVQIVNPKIKLIMVDLDGTLFDTTRTNFMAYREAMRAFGYELNNKYFCDFCNGRHYRDFLPEVIPDASEEIITKIHNMKKVMYKKYVSLATPNVSLMRILDICRTECRLALITTASSENTCDILHEFHLDNYFDLVLTNEDIKYTKPNPEGYIKAMNFFCVTPEECVIFEDSNIGLEAARRSGVQFFKVNIS